jgi:3-hydroxyisobutyrate/3-hydroxypropionate dehydrogenase
MGFHMAANVRKKMPASSTLHVFDVNQAACNRFVEQHSHYGPVRIASSSKALAEASDLIISMVPMDKHAEAVYLDPESGVIASPHSSTRLVLECSTISVEMTRKIGKKIMDAGIAHFIDTPVSGGIWGAEAGTLSFFCGHPDASKTTDTGKRVLTTLGYMGASERITFCGNLGAGLVTKIVNNYIGLTNLAVAAQGLAFGLRHGVDADTLYECVKGGTGDSWIMRTIPPVPGLSLKSPASKGFKPGFTAQLTAKDIGLAIDAAHQVGIDPSLGEVAVKMFQEAAEDPRTKASSPTDTSM